MLGGILIIQLTMCVLVKLPALRNTKVETRSLLRKQEMSWGYKITHEPILQEHNHGGI